MDTFWRNGHLLEINDMSSFPFQENKSSPVTVAVFYVGCVKAFFRDSDKAGKSEDYFMSTNFLVPRSLPFSLRVAK
jgi:hypothetical protein